MKTAITTTAAVVVAVILGSLGLVTLLSGCQIPGKVVSTETSSVCPICKTQTVTSPIKGLTYTKMVCPSCHTETTIDPTREEILRNLGIWSDEQTVHVCDHCKAVVEKCPLCRKQ